MTPSLSNGNVMLKYQDTYIYQIRSAVQEWTVYCFIFVLILNYTLWKCHSFIVDKCFLTLTLIHLLFILFRFYLTLITLLAATYFPLYLNDGEWSLGLCVSTHTPHIFCHSKTPNFWFVTQRPPISYFLTLKTHHLNYLAQTLIKHNNTSQDFIACGQLDVLHSINLLLHSHWKIP